MSKERVALFYARRWDATDRSEYLFRLEFNKFSGVDTQMRSRKPVRGAGNGKERRAATNALVIMMKVHSARIVQNTWRQITCSVCVCSNTKY